MKRWLAKQKVLVKHRAAEAKIKKGKLPRLYNGHVPRAVLQKEYGLKNPEDVATARLLEEHRAKVIEEVSTAVELDEYNGVYQHQVSSSFNIN